jgi:hypothetical protein
MRPDRNVHEVADRPVRTFDRVGQAKTLLAAG